MSSSTTRLRKSPSLRVKTLRVEVLGGPDQGNTVETEDEVLSIGSAEGNALRRQGWYTQAEIAARLGTVPDVIQRALSSMTANGWIAVEREAIVIHDREALAEIAE